MGKQIFLAINLNKTLVLTHSSEQDFINLAADEAGIENLISKKTFNSYPKNL